MQRRGRSGGLRRGSACIGRPQGLDGRFDAAAALIGAGAALALWRFKLGVMPLLGACAAVGLLVHGAR